VLMAIHCVASVKKEHFYVCFLLAAKSVRGLVRCDKQLTHMPSVGASFDPIKPDGYCMYRQV
jgi:hypothetical protein